MSSTRLPNYLRSARKRLSFSQEEVAFLMGARGGAKISSYEGFARLPNLKTALEFEIIYGKPINELFAGLREGVAREIQNRARILRHRVSFQGNEPREAKRRAAVSAIVSPGSVTTNTQ